MKPPDRRSTINPPLPILIWATGQAPTLDEAKAAFRKRNLLPL